MRSIPGRTQLARGIVSYAADGSRQVKLAGGHGSHLLGDLARSNALVLLPAEVDFVAAGDPVDVWLLDEAQH
jgi:molybdopterin molybdotransferase